MECIGCKGVVRDEAGEVSSSQTLTDLVMLLHLGFILKIMVRHLNVLNRRIHFPIRFVF
jgi:hypothetical protein